MVTGDRSDVGGSTASLIGRNAELEHLSRFVAQSAVHGGARVLVGDPGIGKTALLDTLADDAPSTGTRLLRVAVAEFERDVSFAGLNQLLLPLNGNLDELPARHRDALSVALGLTDGSVTDPRMIDIATLVLLRHAAAEEPLLVLLDDLSWLDRASALVLGFVARRLENSKIGLIATLRTGEESYFERASLETLLILPLAERDASALLRDRFPMLTPSVHDRLMVEAAGNPLALLELPRALSPEQRTGQEILPLVLPLRQHLHAMFASRITALPPDARRALLRAALSGVGPVPDPNKDFETAIDPGLEDAQEARLITHDETTRQVAFLHPLIRSAVVALSTSSERIAAHAFLATLAGDDLDKRARHLSESTVRPDEAVAVQIESHALRLMRRGDAVASVAALLRSAQLSVTDAQRARRMADAAYVGASVCGDSHRASELLTQARLANPARSGSLSMAVAGAHLLLHNDADVDTAYKLLLGAVETTSVADAGHALHEAVHLLMQVCYVAGRADWWESFAAAADRARNIDPAFAVSAVTFADPLRCTSAVLAELDDLIRGLDAERDFRRILDIATAAFFVDRLAGCRPALQRVIVAGRSGTAVPLAVNAMILLAGEDFQLGNWDTSALLADEARSLAAAHGHTLLMWLARQHLAVLASVRGDRQGFQQQASAMTSWAVPRGALSFQTRMRFAQGLESLGHGNYANAFEQLSSVSAPGTLPAYQPITLWAVMDVTEAAVKAGRGKEASSHSAAVAAAGIARISSRLAMLCAAGAALSAGPELAADLFRRALDTPASTRWVFDRARVELSFGEHLRRARATSDSRTHLLNALETFERLGATPWATRARAELHATGLSAQPQTTAGLTAQEREIAYLAATGLTNRQIGERLFISPRTVSAHLYRVFPKLGIGSRSALRDALTALDTDPTPP